MSLPHIMTCYIAWMPCGKLRYFMGHTFYAHRKKATIHQLTTRLATSKIVLFPGHNHLLTTGADDPTL